MVTQPLSIFMCAVQEDVNRILRGVNSISILPAKKGTENYLYQRIIRLMEVLVVLHNPVDDLIK
jgi:hypothetical protein